MFMRRFLHVCLAGFASLGLVGCSDLIGLPNTRASIGVYGDVTETMHDTSGRWPDYTLAPEQQQLIRLVGDVAATYALQATFTSQPDRGYRGTLYTYSRDKIEISSRIGMHGRQAYVHLVEYGTKEFSPLAKQILQSLRERLDTAFGANRIRVDAWVVE